MKRTLLLMTLAVGCGLGWAQTTVVQKAPVFDVVSIRQNKNDNVARDYGVTANGYHGRDIPPFLLVITAFVPANGNAGLYNPDQIEGKPDWLLRDNYDIEAKVADEDAEAWKQPEVQRVMLQQMLAERFKLVTHREYREKPVYDLVVAKGGPKFKPSETTDINVIRQTHPAARMLPGGVVAVRGSKQGETTLFGTTLTDLGIFLSSGAGRPIEDKTGLTGKYDITLELDMSPGPDGARPDPATVVITALQEQLGLKLEPAKASVETLVIDHVERPSEN